MTEAEAVEKPPEPEDPLEGMPVAEKKRTVLKENGFDTPQRIARAKLADITDIDSIGEITALDALTWAQEQTGIGGAVSAFDLYEAERDGAVYLTTGCDNLDSLIEGGYHSGYTYMIYGEKGAGKTQVVYQAIAVTAMGGGSVYYLDTENTSKIGMPRIAHMIEARGGDVREAMSRIDVVQASNVEMQMAALNKIHASGQKYDLVVVDGLMTLARAEFSGRGRLAERQGILIQHLTQLNDYAVREDSVVLMTNQVMDKPDQMFGDPVRPIGGHTVLHAAKFLMYMRKAAKGTRIIRLEKAPHIEVRETPVRLTDLGVEDA